MIKFNLRVAKLSAAAALLASFAASPSAAQSGAVERLKAGAERVIAPLAGKTDTRLEQVATFDHQVTGVTVAEDGRVFVNFPRWTEDVTVSVAEVMKDGTIKPYPNDEWNIWRNLNMGGVDPKTHFVSVQSVVADGRGSLWVVDPAAPNSEKIIKDGPKLVQIDLKTDQVKRVYVMAEDIAGPASYLNDIRIAPDGKFAYLTDSGIPGGLVTIDLATGKTWRVLSDDPSTRFEKDVTVMTDGKPLRRPDGRQPLFNADGIALSPDGKTLYWQALTGKTLYRIDTDALQNAGKDPSKQPKAEKVATTEPVDGLWMTKNGKLYLSSIGDNAVKSLNPDGTLKTEFADSRLRWPDTFSEGPDGTLYVTASHIMDSPWFHQTGWVDKNFALFAFKPSEQTKGVSK
jgi:sugar lactone lactonase YvrE